MYGLCKICNQRQHRPDCPAAHGFINVQRHQQAPVKWLADETADSCQDCYQDLNLIRRRHHCRQCGKIFCDKCCYPRYFALGSARPRLCYPCNNNLHRVLKAIPYASYHGFNMNDVMLSWKQ